MDNNDLIIENQQLRKEIEDLKKENSYLKSLLKLDSEEYSIVSTDESVVDVPNQNQIISRESDIKQKLVLFANLFKGREDVYALRWVNKDGSKSGYSPACLNEWRSGICNKGKIKCTECPNRVFAKLDGDIIKKHWLGQKTVGIYPMLKYETCYFLAADFDGEYWKEDVTAYITSCDELGVPASIERSRSGDGAHVWVFFKDAVSAVLARKMGSSLITYSMEKRYQIDFKSYDRLFPNQDTMPSGGFGNLIALPLQKEPALKGNSVFVDRNFQCYKDQMKYLSSIRKMNIEEVQNIVTKAESQGKVLGLPIVNEESVTEKPWEVKISKVKDNDIVKEPLPKEIKCIMHNLIYIYKNDLPSIMINKLVRIAAFQNPEFYKTQALRKSTHNIPRIIKCCDESFDNYIGLPRGCMDEVKRIFQINNVSVFY